MKKKNYTIGYAKAQIRYWRKLLDGLQKQEKEKLLNKLKTLNVSMPDTDTNISDTNISDTNISVCKESKKEEKEKIPPHPSKEIKAEKDKESSSSCARTREIFQPSFLQRWKIPLQFVDYWLEVTDGQEITDPKKSIRNYWSHRKDDESWSEWQKIHPQEVKAKIYSPQDWLLCQERCACFRNGKCSCGITTPPNLQKPRPYPPEECGRFAKL